MRLVPFVLASLVLTTPASSPICCAEHLKPFLPGHPLVRTGGKEAIGPISAAPFGSASILSISWFVAAPFSPQTTFELTRRLRRAYIKMLGGDGLTHSSKVALLNANYAMARLSDHYRVRFTNEKGRCAHEFIIDLAEFDESAGLKVMDFAKRLQVRSSSLAPLSLELTLPFRTLESTLPLARGLLRPPCSCVLSLQLGRAVSDAPPSQIEPTESEGLRDIDQFCDAMIKIRQEADEIIAGKQPRGNNIITNAPHTMQVVVAAEWDRCASFPFLLGFSR